MKTVILVSIEHSKPLPEITDVICQRVWPYGGGCITDMTAEIKHPLATVRGVRFDSRYADTEIRDGDGELLAVVVASEWQGEMVSALKALVKAQP